jgi:hypothetical protein
MRDAFNFSMTVEASTPLFVLKRRTACSRDALQSRVKPAKADPQEDGLAAGAFGDVSIPRRFGLAVRIPAPR